MCQRSAHDQKREFPEPGLGVFEAKFLEPYRLLPVNGQGREADSKIEKILISDCFRALKYILKRFMNTNHLWFLK